VFCVFSGQGVIGLRRHLNGQNIQSSDGRGRFGAHGRVRDDDDLTMTGMMAGAAIDGATPEADGDDAADDEVDEEQLEDISQHNDDLIGLN
jgi:F-box and leucine-rich repeat protein GRR1